MSLLRSEAATRDALSEKVLLEISQNSEEITFARVSFLQNTSGQLLLFITNIFSGIVVHLRSSQISYLRKFKEKVWVYMMAFDRHWSLSMSDEENLAPSDKEKYIFLHVSLNMHQKLLVL